MKSLDSRSDSDLPPTPPYGSNWGHKIAYFVFALYLIAFTALEWIPYMESLYSQSGLPQTLPYGSNCSHKVADFRLYCSFMLMRKPPHCLLKFHFLSLRCMFFFSRSFFYVILYCI